MIDSVVWAQYINVADKHTERQTDQEQPRRHSKCRAKALRRAVRLHYSHIRDIIEMYKIRRPRDAGACLRVRMILFYNYRDHQDHTRIVLYCRREKQKKCSEKPNLGAS